MMALHWQLIPLQSALLVHYTCNNLPTVQHPGVIGGSFDGAGAWLEDEGVFDSSDDVSDNAASESGWDE
jgi:hypothetical protein